MSAAATGADDDDEEEAAGAEGEEEEEEALAVTDRSLYSKATGEGNVNLPANANCFE